MSVPQQREFTLRNGQTLAAQVWQKPGAPVLLALHGWLDNSASFNVLASQLDATVIALDLAGHGHSYHRNTCGPYHLWDDLIDIAEVIDQLDGGPVGLLGHSRGAIIAALFGASQPEKVNALFLIDGLLPEPVKSADVAVQLRKSLTELSRHVDRTFPVYPDEAAAAAVRLQGMFPLSSAAAGIMAARGTKKVDGGVTWRVDPKLLAPSMIKLTAEQILAFAQAITMPACLILASEGMPKLFPGMSKVLKQLPNIRQETLEGSHHLHMEIQSQDVAQIINGCIADMSSVDENLLSKES